MKQIPMLEKFAAQSLVEHDGELIFSKEKFAELIVRECIQVVDDTMTENQEMNIGLVMASAKIVAHFGVEE